MGFEKEMEEQWGVKIRERQTFRFPDKQADIIHTQWAT